MLASRTDGFVPGDLHTLVERGLHSCAERGCSRAALEQGDLEQALEGFTPAALRGVKLFTSSTKWSQVGGLREVRQVLRDTLELPLRYESTVCCVCA